MNLSRNRTLQIFVVFLFSGGLGLLPGAPAQPLPWGQTVVDIQLETDATIRLQTVAGEIVQKTGEPLGRQKVADSLKNLYASGRFRDLRADVKKQGAGVILVFVARARYFVGGVSALVVPHNVRGSDVVSAARLRLGQPLTEADLVSARQRILTLLAGNGYHQAKVSSTLALDTSNQVAGVVFNVSLGTPTVLGVIQFRGQTSVAPAKLKSVSGWRSGKHINSTLIDRGIARIHKFYVKRERLEASASVVAREYNPKDHSENLSVKVNEGPLVKVRVAGVRVSASALKQVLPVYNEGLVDDVSLNAGSRDLANYLERQGYYSAQVKWNRSTGPGSNILRITYTVAPGSRSAFGGYTFAGNHAFPDSDLASILQIQPHSFPGNLRGVFSHKLLNEDVQSMTSLYQSRGFLAVKVVPKIKQGSGELWVTFSIDEGPQSKVRRLSLKGVAAATARKLCSTLPMKPGRPYSPALAARDRDAIFSYFSKQGYNQAAVSWTVSPESPKHTVDLVYSIKPGDREFVQALVLVHDEHVRPSVILRRVTFKPGQPLDEGSLFSSQTRLYDLGLFSQVQIAPTGLKGPEGQRTVLVSVDEAHRWTLGYGGGVDVQRLSGNQPQGQLGASPRVSLELTRIGVGGRNQTFSVSGRVSSLETGAATSYSIPDFLNHPDLTLHITGTNDRTRDVQTFTSSLDEGTVDIQKQFGPGTYILARYDYRYVTVSNLRISPETIPLISQPARIGSVGSTFVRDTRDDPADATRGSFTLFDGTFAAAKLGSQANYWRWFGQNSTYYRLGTHVVFARNTQVGVESPYGSSRPVSAPGVGSNLAFSNEIPLPERFFAGGSDSLRAFSLDQAGPRDPVTGFPIGGDALFVNSLELRIPLAQGRYGIVLFNDAGNVFSDFSTMRLLKFTQTSPADLNYDVEAVGLGLRFKTPVGPFRVDLAYAINGPRFQFTEPSPQIQQLSKFQYFVSIGQSF